MCCFVCAYVCMHIIVHAFVHMCLACNNMHLVLNQETLQYIWYICFIQHNYMHAYICTDKTTHSASQELNVAKVHFYIWYITWEDWRATVRVKTFIRHGDRQTYSKQLYSLIPLQVWNPIYLQLLILVFSKNNPSSSTAVDIFTFSIGLYRFK